MVYLVILVLILLCGFAEVFWALCGVALLGIIGFFGLMALCHM